jgi:predicted nucleic acid-binding protein
MDLMLALTEDAMHEILWTETLLAEWEHVIVRERRRSPTSAAAITAAIREFFPEGQVVEDAYAALIEEMPGADLDDRHHMAAAVAGGASAIVTWNRRDFPADGLARHGIQVMDPDEYLCGLIVEFPHEVVDTITRMAGQKKRPPLTAYDLADSLDNAGVPNFAARLRDHLDLSQAGDPSHPPESRHRDSRTTPQISAPEVGAFLAIHRPPDCHAIELVVPPHKPVGPASHLIVLNAALVEMLTAWPNGTTLVVEYDDEAYVQAVAYPPHLLTEIGRLTPEQMPGAVTFGWMDPRAVRAPHGDFDSQPVWVDNPVREWVHPYDPPRQIAAFLAASVRAILGRDPGEGYVLRMFNDLVESK